MHKNITMVIIDTENKVLANHALIHSYKVFPTERVLAITDSLDCFEGFEKILIDKITSIEDYNNVVINFLPNIIYTKFVLIIQFDGFIINSNLFTSVFMNYDYIGASWPHVTTYTVGNGGFSLRSLKILKATKELSYLRKNNMPEDEFICRYIKTILEYDYNINFAPVEIADLFSVEYKKIATPTFGFHGFHHLPKVYSKDVDFLLSNLSPRYFKGRFYNLLNKIYGNNILNKYIKN
jgi:hypothetical protein